jgi:hypothetical protein
MDAGAENGAPKFETLLYTVAAPVATITLNPQAPADEKPDPRNVIEP